MKRIVIGLLFCAVPLLSPAEEMHGEHSAHSMHSMNHVTADDMPEGAWAPTGMEISPGQRCTLAARGVVMLDNAAWAACGGKPAAAARSVVPTSLDSPHTGH